MKPDPVRDCEHGSRRGKCARCALYAAEERAERAEADNERLREALGAMLYDLTPADNYPTEAAIRRARDALAGEDK